VAVLFFFYPPATKDTRLRRSRSDFSFRKRPFFSSDLNDLFHIPGLQSLRFFSLPFPPPNLSCNQFERNPLCEFSLLRRLAGCVFFYRRRHAAIIPFPNFPFSLWRLLFWPRAFGIRRFQEQTCCILFSLCSDLFLKFPPFPTGRQGPIKSMQFRLRPRTD